MLTPTQAQCLSAIERHLADHGCAPSYEELAAALGQRSKSGIHRMIVALEQRGFIRRIPCCARAIEIIKPQPSPSADYWQGFRDGAEAERAKLRTLTDEEREWLESPPVGREII